MKKLILLFAAIAITAGAYAQTDSTNRKMSLRYMKDHQSQTMQNNPVDTSHPDGVIMQNGKMMKVKNGKMTILDDDMTMSNGTKIMSNGTWINKDGTRKEMKEGQHIDMSGNMTPMKTHRDKNMDHNRNVRNNPDELYPDGVMMQNGQMMMVKDGKMRVIDQDMTMSNGTKVMRDGNYIGKDGKRLMMKEGQHMDMSGNINPMKTNKHKNMYLVPDSTRKRNY